MKNAMRCGKASFSAGEALYNASPLKFGTLDMDEAMPDSSGPQGSPLVQVRPVVVMA